VIGGDRHGVLCAVAVAGVARDNRVAATGDEREKPRPAARAALFKFAAAQHASKRVQMTLLAVRLMDCKAVANARQTAESVRLTSADVIRFFYELRANESIQQGHS